MADNNVPLTDRTFLEENLSGYTPPTVPDLPNIAHRAPSTPDMIMPRESGDARRSTIKDVDNFLLSKKDDGSLTGGGIRRTLAEVTSPRYKNFIPGGYNNEDAYGQGQGWGEKMVNGVAKGLLLTGTTFLQSTVGLVNGLNQWRADGRFASFYDNDFNRSIDEITKQAEDNAPNYYTDAEKNAAWYSGKKLFSANFLWDGFVKNLGFVAGAALSGGVYTAGLKALPLTAKLFSIAKGAQALAATEEAILAGGNAAKTFGKIKELSDKFIAGYKVSNFGGRAIVAGLSTTGEAGFEAFHNMNEHRDAKINKWKEDHFGEEPTGADLDAINMDAESVGNSSFFLNTALLTATNYIQFPKILGSSYKAEKGMINSLVRETNEIVGEAGKYTAKQATTRIGKILSTANKIRPYTFSASEAFEEGAQYAIQSGVQDYYNKKNKDRSFFDSVYEGVKETITTNEGMENVLIGGLSGALVSARGTYLENKEKSANTVDAIQKFNKFKLSNFTKATIDSVNRGVVLQEDREEHLKNGEILKSKDSETDYIINYLSPRIKYGRFDLVKSEIDDYKTLAATDEGFAQLVAEGKAFASDTKEAYLMRLANLEATANNIKSLYQSLDLRYGGLLNEKGDPLYSSAVMDKMVYAATKIADYDVRIPSVSSKLIESQVPIGMLAEEVGNGNFDSFDEAVKNINSRQDLTDDQKLDLQIALADVAEMSALRSNFVKEYNEIKKSPKSFEDVQVSSTSTDGTSITNEKPKVIVKTKTGDEELIIGEEYIIGQGVDFEKEGLDTPVAIDSITILGENEDGTIKIKGSDGVIKDVPKSVLEEYKLSTKSAITSNKTANYFYNHRDEIFEYNFGKTYGGKKQGRLQYDGKSLFFVYKDDSGKIRKKKIDNTHFVTQEGYGQPRIKKVGDVKTKEQITSEEEFTSPEEIAIQKETLASKRDIRLKIVVELETETRERLNKLNKKLDNKKKELDSIQKDLNELTGKEIKVREASTKKGKALEEKYPELSRQKIKFNKIFSTVTKSLTKLSRMKESVEIEIGELTSEKNELELNLSYFQDFSQNLDELPENSGEFLAELKNQVSWLDALVKETGDSINTLAKLSKTIDNTIKDFAQLLKDSLQKFDKDYPQYIKDSIERMMENPTFSEVQILKEYLVDYALLQDIQKEISVNENKIKEIDDQAAKLYEQLDELGAEYNAKKELLDRFQSVVDVYQAKKAEEDKILSDEESVNKLLKTSDTSVQTEKFDKEYEVTPKKSDEIIPRATVGVMRGKPHQVRANAFGFNLNKFVNRKNIRGVYITSKNEDQLIPGLTDRLRMDESGNINEDVKKDEIITLVMVTEDENGNIKLVGEDGQIIPDGVDPLDFAIYQVFPSENLKFSSAYGNESMFRTTTPDEVVSSITSQYKEWRDKTLKASTTIGNIHEIEASFGIVDNVKDENDKINYETKTSVQDAGLVNEDDLEATQLINIPTLPTEGDSVVVVNKGTTSFKVTVGTVLLETADGLVKLNNKKNSKKDAKVIFDAIHQLAKNMVDPKIGIGDPESTRLLNWLKSVVYWGIPEDQSKNRKPAGYNSIFFEKDETTGKLMLSISNKGKDFIFTPTNLEDNENAIIDLISTLYNNINSHKSKQLNESYEEILSISEDGTINSRTWINYQSYLLSNKNPDGSVRSGESLPLSTTIRPLVGENDINRTSIYFYTTDTADDFVIPVVEKKKKITPKVLTPGGPKQKAPAPQPVVAQPTSSSADAKADIESAFSYITKRKYEGDRRNEVNKVGEDLAKRFVTTLKEKGLVKEDYRMAPRTDGSLEKMRVNTDSEGNNLGNDWSTAGKFKEEFRKFVDAELAALEGNTPTAVPITSKQAADDSSGMPPAQTYYELDNKTPNTYTSPEGKKIIFIAPSDVTKETVEKITILKGGDLDSVVDVIKKAGKDPVTELKRTIFNAIAPTINEIRALEAEFGTVTIPDDAMEVIVNDAENQLGKPIDQDITDQINEIIIDNDDEVLREIIENETEPFVAEDWKKVEAWLKANFPNIPVYRVENIIKSTNGRQAWGMFRDGAIYISTNAEVGTTYHEVFHAVWRMFTDSAEQKQIIDEMRSRGGKFFDRSSLSDVSYSEATERQLEEKLAEEFRDYVQYKKIPAKPSKGRPFILKLFADMFTSIKEFFFKDKSVSKVEEMFSKINQGYYKSNLPLVNSLSYANVGIIDIENIVADSESVLSLVGISDKERSEIIQHMTYLTLSNFIKNDKSLFEIDKINKKQEYAKLKYEIYKTVAKKARAAQTLVREGKRTQDEVNPHISRQLQLMQNIKDQWESITEKHEEYLKNYQLEFDENDNLTLKDEDKSGRGDYQDASKIDSFRKSNSAIKILLGTIPKVNKDGKIIPSTIGGAQLLPVGKTYISLMNNLYNSSSIEDMLDGLREMAKNDPDYRSLYKRITKKSWNEGGIDLTKIEEEHGLQLISAFWSTFKKQNPDVKTVFILENGEIAVGDTNLSTAAQELRNQYTNAIVLKAKSGGGFFIYDEKEKAYKGDPLKLRGVNISDKPQMIDFLDKIGISFTLSEINRMTTNQYASFKEAVAGIKESISKSEKIATFSKKTLDISKRLLELGLVKAAITNPEFSSTYFSVSGERTQSYIGTNAASDLATFFSKLERYNDASVGGTPYNYLLTDSFSKYSNLLSRMFTKNGVRKADSKDLFTVGYVSGVDNEGKGKRKSSSSLSYRDRLIQELNLNLKGWYLNLVPGDASLEWMIKMGNAISTSSVGRGMGDINEIFKGYFLSELELAREDRPVPKGRNSKDMRFFKSILGDDLHKEIIKDSGTLEEVYNKFEKRINSKLEDYMKADMNKLKASLLKLGILKQDVLGFSMQDVDISNNLSEKEMNNHLMALTANYMISNIEMHKLLYSDPYQYEDELKRIKSFSSPRQSIISNSPKMNSAFNRIWNKDYSNGDIGHTKFTQDYFRSATHADVLGIIDVPNYDYAGFKETDGGGIITMKANRQFRIRAGQWNKNEERQYKYDIAWEKEYKNLKLSDKEEKLLKEGNPGVQSAYTPLKPIVSGTKLSKDGSQNSINEIVLDKFSLYPLSYRIVHEINKDANAIKLYDKMQREDIDYVVFKSSRKVGSETLHETYKNGDFNNDPYESITNIPFSIMSIQSEVPSKEDNLVTRGSQITKLITLDFLEAGVPVDFLEGQPFPKRYKEWYKLSDEEAKLKNSEIYRLVKDNQNLLEAMIEEGYRTTLDKLGIKETLVKKGDSYEKKYEITDFSKAAKTLRDEVLKREVDDNITDALKAFFDGSAVLEATPAYQQVRNILYSIADKNFISPKISGGSKVQIFSTFLESETRKLKDGLYESDVLKFYEKDGKRVAEVMLARWFNSPLSDEELMDYFNNDPEGQKQLAILAGVGFRIPTQKQNSIDAIVIAKFLPKEFGDSVVIPAALVQKVGSDFDIDKLSVYLKNVYTKNGKPKLIPYFGIGQQAKDKFKELFEKGEFLTEEETLELDRYIAEQELLLEDLSEEGGSAKLMSSIISNLFSEEDLVEEFTGTIPSKEKIINALYKKSLENAYIQNMENLITHPKNYDSLVRPNSAEDLKDLSKFISGKVAGGTFDYNNVGNMLDRTYMSNLRHAFVTGKRAIGIAAVNQTNHALNQLVRIFIDTNKLSNVSDEDKFWLNDGSIKFREYNTIEVNNRMVPTLSMIKDKAKNFISGTIGMFIDGYVDISKGLWIMELGATPNVASTWLFLIKLGVPIKSVAYFMNQPIIREYLQTIENAGYSWLFMDNFVKNMAGVYGQNMSQEKLNDAQKRFTIPSETELESLLGKDVSELTPQQKTDQYLMLLEFLKYAKMGEQLFHVTQGSNYDTATFNDPYLVFKKEMQRIKAQNTIISSVDDLINNSFIGFLANGINDIRNAFAEILKSDNSNVRKVMHKVLMPYVDLNNGDFIKIAQKAVSDLFDWAVQTDQDLNLTIQDILINNGGVAKEITLFINDVKKDPKHPLYGNRIIEILKGIPSMRAAEGGANNAKLNMGESSVYNQNDTIYAFRELRDYLKGQNSPLYERIVSLAILQSGLSRSPISFTSVLPYEDFEKIYSKTLSKLEGLSNLEDFYELGVFQRNNWNNDDIVPYLKAPLIKSKTPGQMHYNPSMKFLPMNVKKAIEGNKIPPILTQAKRNREANSDYIVYTWEKQEDLLTEKELKEALSSGPLYKAVASKKSAMRARGDYSYINKGLFKKVYDDYGTPLEHTGYDGTKYFVYKTINAWGDSFRANEFWRTEHASVIENGFMKVDGVNNNVIIDLFNDKNVKASPTNNKFGSVSQVKVIQPKGRPAIDNINKNNCG